MLLRSSVSLRLRRVSWVLVSLSLRVRLRARRRLLLVRLLLWAVMLVCRCVGKLCNRAVGRAWRLRILGRR